MFCDISFSYKSERNTGIWIFLIDSLFNPLFLLNTSNLQRVLNDFISAYTYMTCTLWCISGTVDYVLTSHKCFVTVDGEEDYLSSYINKFWKPLLALFCCVQMSQQNYYQMRICFSLWQIFWLDDWCSEPIYKSNNPFNHNRRHSGEKPYQCTLYTIIVYQSDNPLSTH